MAKRRRPGKPARDDSGDGKAGQCWRLLNGTIIALGGLGYAIAQVIAALHGNGGHG
jgi:hypothetical protein